MARVRFVGLILQLSLLFGARSATAERSVARSLTLENGLKVLLLEDHRRPRVAVSIAYGAGFRDEPAGYRGLAHLTEHLMFQGTRHVAKDGVARALERAGALGIGAHTSPDQTVFEEEMPRRSYAVALWLESDRMAFMLDGLTSALVDREASVLRNERLERRGPTSWGDRVELVSRELYPKGHPYYRMGDEADLGSIGLRDVQWFFQTHYRPDNATLALVGDFDPEEAEKLVRLYFEPVRSAGPKLARPSFEKARVTETRRIVVEERVTLRGLLMVWPTPARGERGNLALHLIADCVTRTGSFLQRTLPGRPIGAVSMRASEEDLDGGSLFLISVLYSRGTNPAKVERLIDIELDSLRGNPTANCDLETLRKRSVAKVLSEADYLPMATRLAVRNETPDQEVQQLSAVTGTDISEIAGVLTRDRRVVFELH